jgi:regulator of sigma E protease
VKTSSEADKNILETTYKGKIGVMIGKIPSYVGVVPGSRADQAGLKTFDRVVSVNGQSVVSRGEMLTAVKKAGANPVTLQVVRNEPFDLKTTSVSTAQTLTLSIPGGSDAIGIDIPDLYVREVLPDSKAFAAGMRPGDKIVAVDGTPVVSGMRLEAILADKKDAMLADKKSVTFTVERAGSKQDLTYEAVTLVKKDKLMGTVPTVELGFRPHPRIYTTEPFKPEELVQVQYGIVKAFSRASEQTVAVTRQMALGIGAMINGRVSSEHLGGVIMLYQLTSVATENGLASFLQLFALISINLGLMNLLPVPALDGFHILVSGIEGISRRAIPMRVREIAQVVGIVMILSLMALAFKNDIMRIVRADSETSLVNHR